MKQTITKLSCKQCGWAAKENGSNPLYYDIDINTTSVSIYASMKQAIIEKKIIGDSVLIGFYINNSDQIIDIYDWHPAFNDIKKLPPSITNYKLLYPDIDIVKIIIGGKDDNPK